LRWKVQVLNSSSYNKPLVRDTGPTPNYNLGGIAFDSIKVKKVQFYGM